MKTTTNNNNYHDDHYDHDKPTKRDSHTHRMTYGRETTLTDLKFQNPRKDLNISGNRAKIEFKKKTRKNKNNHRKTIEKFTFIPNKS